MALYAALYIVLWYVGAFIPFLKMTQGGSIELEFAALFVASYHLGWKKGILTALAAWLLEVILGGANWYLNPMQYALDYIIPLVAGGAASLFWKGKNKSVIGIAIAMVLKYCSTVLSGAYFWPPEGGAAGSAAAWTFSLGYNLWYNLATCIVCVILVPLLIKRLDKAHMM